MYLILNYSLSFFSPQIQEYEKNEDKLRTGKTGDFAFDFFFELGEQKSRDKDSDDTDSGDSYDGDEEQEVKEN